MPPLRRRSSGERTTALHNARQRARQNRLNVQMRQWSWRIEQIWYWLLAAVVFVLANVKDRTVVYVPTEANLPILEAGHGVK
ncbi:MAG: hypothetical protein JO151_13535 [Verrucomicrobia bacterium]|nr:hypothetical protein [Verrucomicrobiota bacterium]